MYFRSDYFPVKVIQFEPSPQPATLTPDGALWWDVTSRTLKLFVNGKPIAASAPVVAVADVLVQSANIPTTTLYTVPTNTGGTYRITAYTVLTQVATTSSTLPNPGVNYTDNDTGALVTNLFWGSTPTTNTLGISSNVGGNMNGTATFSAKAGTAIQILTANYASTGATPMQFALHAKLEYLGA
jgi:hypothetical protein